MILVWFLSSDSWSLDVTSYSLVGSDLSSILSLASIGEDLLNGDYFHSVTYKLHSDLVDRYFRLVVTGWTYSWIRASSAVWYHISASLSVSRQVGKRVV